jgi:hypothetical protein
MEDDPESFQLADGFRTFFAQDAHKLLIAQTTSGVHGPAVVLLIRQATWYRESEESTGIHGATGKAKRRLRHHHHAGTLFPSRDGCP